MHRLPRRSKLLGISSTCGGCSRLDPAGRGSCCSGKVQAIALPRHDDLCKNPQVEEAFLAAMEDPSESVRLAAVQGIIDATERCGQCNSGCNGCCTTALQQKLWKLAHDVDDRGCWSESSPKVRRLARIASLPLPPIDASNFEPSPRNIPVNS